MGPFWEKSLVVTQKVKPYDPAIPLLGIYPKEVKTYVHIENLYMSGHSSIVQNSQKVETAQMSIS